MEKKFSFTLGNEKKTVIVSKDRINSILGLAFIGASALLLAYLRCLK